MGKYRSIGNGSVSATGPEDGRRAPRSLPAGGEAATLLAPLLHAAALDRRPISDVVSWLDAQTTASRGRSCGASGASAAAAQLRAVLDLDPRNQARRSGLGPAGYRFPKVLATANVDVTPELLLDGTPTTSTSSPGERHQRLLAPLIVCLVSEVLELVPLSVLFGRHAVPREGIRPESPEDLRRNQLLGAEGKPGAIRQRPVRLRPQWWAVRCSI